MWRCGFTVGSVGRGKLTLIKCGPPCWLTQVGPTHAPCPFHSKGGPQWAAQIDRDEFYARSGTAQAPKGHVSWVSFSNPYFSQWDCVQTLVVQCKSLKGVWGKGSLQRRMISLIVVFHLWLWYFTFSVLYLILNMYNFIKLHAILYVCMVCISQPALWSRVKLDPGCFPPWYNLFGKTWTQQLYLDVDQNNCTKTI